MAAILDDAEIGIPCENCGRKTQKSIGWIKRNSSFTCACGTTITIEADQFKREIAKVEQSFADLKKSIEKMGKR